MSWNSVRRNRRKPISGQPKHEIFRKTTVTTVSLQSVKTCENQWRAAQSPRISKGIPGDPFGCFVFEHHHFGWFSITSGMLLLSRMSVGSISISSRNPWLTQVIWKINNIHQFLIQNRWRLRVFSPTKFVPAPTRRKGTRTTSQSWGEASYSHNWQSCNFWVWK
jgi:hypothetical protein